LRRYAPEFLAVLDTPCSSRRAGLAGCGQCHPWPECRRCQKAPGRCTELCARMESV
jgi:hypothetical protein